MHILVDMDGTIADWGKQYDADLNAFGWQAADIPRTKDQKAFNLKQDRSITECRIIDAVMNRPGFYAELEPIPGAIDALKRLVADGHEVSIASSPWWPNPTCVQDKHDWLVKHLGPEWADRLVITKDKTLVDGDILIDDKPEITGKIEPRWEHILFDQPYNSHVINGHRMYSWSQAEVDLALLQHGVKKEPKPVRDTLRVYGQGTNGIDAARGAMEKILGEVRTTSSTGGQKGVKSARFDLIPTGALTKLAEHYGVGALKYDDNQWRKSYEWSKSYAALQRHAVAFWGGEDFDEETGSEHMAAVAWHAFTLMTFFDEDKQFDDRFKPVSSDTSSTGSQS